MPSTPRFSLQSYHVLLLLLWYYNVVVVLVSCFHVTKRSQSGDNVFGYIDDINYATYISTGKEQRLLEKEDEIVQSTTLVPISTKPILLVSSGSPLLSKKECELLSEYFSTKKSTTEGKLVLEKLQKSLDKIICRKDDAIVEPRYLFYEKPSGIVSEDQSNDIKESKHYDSLFMLLNHHLPDGLHVDTNNGKYFRYLTILVYLTNSHAATVFPLANLDTTNDTNRENQHQNDALIHAAEYLIRNDIYHTRQVVEAPLIPTNNTDELDTDKIQFYEEMIDDIQTKQRLIENAALTTTTVTSTLGSNINSNGGGIRVIPQQGHVAIFVNIDTKTGCTDPYTFHGPELAMDEKQVLTFFYEIPYNQFTSQKEFGQQVAKRIEQIQHKYY